MKTLHQGIQSYLTTSMAIDLLKKGNKRYQKDLLENKTPSQRSTNSTSNHNRFAIVLNYIAPIAPSHLIFGQNPGAILDLDLTNHKIDQDILVSVEFACKVVRSKIIVVLGCTNNSSKNMESASNTTEMNIKNLVKDIIIQSPTLKEMIESGAVGILGGMHNLSTGEVQFYTDAMIVHSKWINE